MSNRLCFPRVLILLSWGLALAAPGLAQRGAPDPVFETVPFEKWVAEGPRVQIPWKVRVSSAGLSIHQRLVARAEAQVDGKELEKRRGEGRLLVFVQFKDRQGNAYQDDAVLELKDVQPGARKTIVALIWEAFVLPGDYEVTLALYNTKTEEHNLARRSLRIDPLENDPLRGAWHDLPSAEIFKSTEGHDRFFRPEATGRLHLPLETRQPVEIELVMNATPSEYSPGSRKVYEANLSALLPILKILTQIEIKNGLMKVATLDVTRRRVSFEQEKVKELDWAGLKAALAAADPGVIDVRELQKRKENAAFLREELARRIETHKAQPALPAGDPLRVFILVGTPMAFASQGRTNPLSFPEGCNCVVYYLRYELWAPTIAGPFIRFSPAAIDEVAGMLKPLKPRVLSAHTPEGLRKALATMLDELSRQ